MQTLITDLKLGFRLLRREGLVRFISRLIWYFRGARLRGDIFDRKPDHNFASWTLHPKDIPALENFPMVSVIIPIYNHENFVAQAIKSAQEQNYPSEKLEIICLDDGSRDRSFEVAKKILASGKNPFQCIKQENMGAHATINKGLKMASGKYLAILNSDDYFAPNRFRVLVSALENANPKGSAFAFGGVGYINETGNPLNDELAESYEKMQQYAVQFETAGFAIMDGNIAITTGNFVFTRELFAKIGDFNDYKFCHDWDFLLRSVAFCEPLFVTEKLYHYRFHGHNSFLSLQELLPGEVSKILKNFFRIKNSENPEFPCAKNFGKPKNYFGKFIKTHGYKKYMP